MTQSQLDATYREVMRRAGFATSVKAAFVAPTARKAAPRAPEPPSWAERSYMSGERVWTAPTLSENIAAASIHKARPAGAISRAVADMASGRRGMTSSEPIAGAPAATAERHMADERVNREWYAAKAAAAQAAAADVWLPNGEWVSRQVADACATLSGTVTPSASDIDAARLERTRNSSGPAPTTVEDVVRAATARRRSR